MNSGVVIEKAINNFDSFAMPRSPPESLSLLNYMQSNIQKAQPFADIDVLFIQHHLGPFIGRLNAMKLNGLDPDRSWFIDIPYSTNKDVSNKLKEMGFSKRHRAKQFDDPLSDYNASQAHRVASLIKVLERRKNPRPLLVIDDGAYFIRYLNSLLTHLPSKLNRYVGTSVVEQTTRGHRYIFNQGLEVIKKCGLSVVTIAKCKTKKEFEGPFIGAAVSRAMRRSIGDDRILNAQRIGVIGYGVVGEATVREICRICPDAKVDVADIEAGARAKASLLSDQCDGLSQLDDRKEYDIVLGCTGYNSFHLDQRKMLADGAVLASGSSAAIEFNRAGFIELADKYDNDAIELLNKEKAVAAGIHANICMRQENGKCFEFLNAGFPVNFDGRIECLPTIVIQATHGLLFMAGIQALSQKGMGIDTIASDLDQWIFELAVKELSESPEVR